MEALLDGKAQGQEENVTQVPTSTPTPIHEINMTGLRHSNSREN
jgi:hypothetical protein